MAGSKENVDRGRRGGYAGQDRLAAYTTPREAETVRFAGRDQSPSKVRRIEAVIDAYAEAYPEWQNENPSGVVEAAQIAVDALDSRSRMAVAADDGAGHAVDPPVAEDPDVGFYGSDLTEGRIAVANLHGVPGCVKVGPHHYSVEEDPYISDRSTNGETYPEHCRIAYNSGANMHVSALRETLLHEVLHAVWHAVGGLEVAEETKDMEEIIVNALAPTLLGVVRDNPDLVTFLTAGD